MNCHFHRFLPVMCLWAWGVTSGFTAAQQSPQPPPPATSGISADGGGGERVNKGVQGLPYSAEEVTETTQTLADGTKVTRQERFKVYRDSEGRERHEFFGPPRESGKPDDTPLNVDIYDPVAGVTYVLDPRRHTARRTELGHTPPRPPRQTTSTLANELPALPQVTQEDLGTQVIQGLKVKGTRRTITYAAGTIGNDGPIVSTDEGWYSPELALEVTRIFDDPRTGEKVMRLTNLVRDEPSAELFRVPSDYKVQDLRTIEGKPVPFSE